MTRPEALGSIFPLILRMTATARNARPARIRMLAKGASTKWDNRSLMAVALLSRAGAWLSTPGRSDSLLIICATAQRKKLRARGLPGSYSCLSKERSCAKAQVEQEIHRGRLAEKADQARDFK